MTAGAVLVRRRTLWAHALACASPNPLADKFVGLAVEVHNKLGVSLAGHGQSHEAIAHFRKALEIKPDDMNAHYNLALVLAGQGMPDEASEHFQTALGLAAARNDRALAKLIRTQIRRCQPVAPAGNAR